MARTRLRGLEIGGIQIGIEVPETSAWEWPDAATEEFSCLPRDPEVHVGIRIGDVGDDDLGGEHYAMGAWTFEVARRGSDWMLGLSRSGRREQLAVFDAEFRTGEVVFSRESAHRPGYPLRSPLDEWIVLHRNVARGGLCLNAHASSHPGGARVRLGAREANSISGWTTPTTTLLGHHTLWLRDDGDDLRIYRTPWGGAMESPLGSEARVLDFTFSEEAELPYRELLDPADAAEVLVTHAVVPLCDDRLLELVLRNAKRIGERARVHRIGEKQTSAAPMAWQSTQMQSGFAPPRGAV